MSAARDGMMALVARVANGHGGAWPAGVRQHLDAYRAEVLREAVAEIWGDSKSPLIQQDGKFHGGMQHAADLIDPDKAES